VNLRRTKAEVSGEGWASERVERVERVEGVEKV
jgi:hypothetical protein